MEAIAMKMTQEEFDSIKGLLDIKITEQEFIKLLQDERN